MKDSGKAVYIAPRLSKGPVVSVVGAMILASLIFLALPLTQLLSGLAKPETREIASSPTLPPPPAPPPEPPPPQEEEVEETKPELEEKQQRLDLNQLDVALNPGFGDALAMGTAIIGFGVTPNTIAQMEIFELKDLDNSPRRIFAVNPVYPFQFKRDRIEGRVRVEITVDKLGRVVNAKVRDATHREFEQPAIDAVLKWKFEPGTKNGEPVMVRRIQPISFKLS